MPADAEFDPFDDPPPRSALDDVADSTAEIARDASKLREDVGAIEVQQRELHAALMDRLSSSTKTLNVIAGRLSTVAWLLFAILAALLFR